MTRHNTTAVAARSLVVVAAAGLALAACRDLGRLDDHTASILSDPEKRHPIEFTDRSEVLYVEVSADGEGLSANQRTDVYRFVERYKIEGKGRLAIALPGGARGHLAASRAMRQVEDIAQGAGLPPEAMQTTRGRAGGGYGAAIRLAYERPEAVAPRCGDWPEDLGENRERLPHANFGCATQRNLALSVANGRDLQHPQQETPRSGERRQATWSTYAGVQGGGGGSAAPGPAGGAPPAAPGSKAAP